MVWSLLDPFGLSLTRQKPSNWSTLFTLRRMVIFDHYNGIIFIVIVFHDSYYVKNHPLKGFQVHIFPFDWVLGAMTFQLPLDFHPIFSYPKPQGLTWDHGGSILLYLKKLCFKFHINPMWESKVIGPLSWVPNLGINSGEGKWPRINPNVLTWFYSDLELPSTYINVYKHHISTL